MNSNFKQSTKRILKRSVAIGAVALSLSLMPLSAFAAKVAPIAPVTLAVSVQALSVSGQLPDANKMHFLQVQPTVRDGIVTLTLSMDPKGAQNSVNMWVLNHQELQSYQAGAKLSTVALATGNPMPGKSDSYKVQSSFKAVGNESYTVAIYNRTQSPASYTLTANGANLIDDSGQTLAHAPLQQPNGAMVSATSPSAKLNSALSVLKVKGALTTRGQQQYYTVKPSIHDGIVTLTLDYNPSNNSQLDGKVNFFVFNPEGLSALRAGGRPDQVNLAAGSIVKAGVANKLQAAFKATGDSAYTIVVLSHADAPSEYALSVNGGQFQ